MEKTGDIIAARIEAVKEYLKYYLDYDERELQKLEIEDVKQAANDDVIYVALGDREQVKEIHYRRAASGNVDLVARDYIPPQFHTRYMTVAARAKVIREEDKDVKTQIRWGERDVEMFLKRRGENEQFKKVELFEFMAEAVLPDVDFSIKWKIRAEKENRRKLNFGKERVQLPSLVNGKPRQALVRKHSDFSRMEKPKRSRDDLMNDLDVEKDTEEDMEEEKDEEEEDEEV